MTKKISISLFAFLFLILLTSAFLVKGFLLKESEVTAELAEVINIDRDQSTIVIRNVSGQETLVKVKVKDIDHFQLNSFYWIEYKSFLRGMPKLISYKLIKFDG